MVVHIPGKKQRMPSNSHTCPYLLSLSNNLSSLPQPELQVISFLCPLWKVFTFLLQNIRNSFQQNIRLWQGKEQIPKWILRGNGKSGHSYLYPLVTKHEDFYWWHQEVAVSTECIHIYQKDSVKCTKADVPTLDNRPYLGRSCQQPLGNAIYDISLYSFLCLMLGSFIIYHESMQLLEVPYTALNGDMIEESLWLPHPLRLQGNSSTYHSSRCSNIQYLFSVLDRV